MARPNLKKWLPPAALGASTGESSPSPASLQDSTMRFGIRSVAACSLALALGWTSLAAAQEQPQQAWGDLEGSFELVGQAPAPKPVAVGPGNAVCAAFNLVDESLVVGRRNGIANIVVMLQPTEGAAPAIHPNV